MCGFGRVEVKPQAKKTKNSGGQKGFPQAADGTQGGQIPPRVTSKGRSLPVFSINRF